MAVEEIRAHAHTIGRLYAVYVVVAEWRPLGYLRWRDLLSQPDTARVGDLMHTDFIAVEPDTDQEAVARIAERFRNAPSGRERAHNRAQRLSSGVKCRMIGHLAGGHLTGHQ